MFSRRHFLAAMTCAALPGAGGALATTTSRPGTRIDELVNVIDPVLDMRNAHTGERINLRYFSLGSYDLDAVRRIYWFMRDHRQGEAIQMDARLLWTLSALRMAAMRDGHSGKTILLSGYRSKRTNEMLRARGIAAARNSLHLTGRAADITLEGVRISDLATYARWLQVGGVGYYRRSNFVHIDSGRERSWGS